jgi:gliding motility-associated lipoprotein GldH
MRSSLYLIALWMLSMITACNIHSIYEKSEDIPKEEWNKHQAVKFEIPVTDTINGYRIVVNVRNSNEYPYSNLFLFITTYSPKGYSIKDTLEMTLANDQGKWLGTGFGGVWSTEADLRNSMIIRFPSAGVYKMEILQAMRDDVLRGIKDIGIRVEKAK